MHSVVILGTGNLAQHLCVAFSKTASVEVIQVFGRNTAKLKSFKNYAETCSNPLEIKDADVYLIAVKDDAITEVSKHLIKKNGVVAHTSGATGLDGISLENRAVFYPVQTFTKDKPVNFKTIPIGIEASNEKGLSLLKFLAEQISDNIYEINSEQRKQLHLAAVFVNNFTNHLYRIGQDICTKASLPFDMLKPLILETAEKLGTISPQEAQTGPARRADKKSIQRHLELIDTGEEKEIYNLLTEAIKTRYEKKL